MGKVEENKRRKEAELYNKGYQLFVNKGVERTTIEDITSAAGLAKGTFYLYFKDKYELRDKLIVKRSKDVLGNATKYADERNSAGFENKMRDLIDSILDQLEQDRMLIKFINKNLSWGIFAQAMESAEDETHIIIEHFAERLAKEGVRCEKPEIFIFTIFELVSATSYSCILYDRPVPLSEYRPHLHRCIHEIIGIFTEQQAV